MTMHPNEEQQRWSDVVRRIRAGTPDAFREIVEEYQESVRFTVAYYFRGDPELIDEMVHRTFIQAFRALERFDASRPLAPWLKEIARNQAINELRRRGRENAMKKDLVSDRLAEARQTLDPPWERLDALRTCIQALRDDAQKMVNLHYYQQMPLAQVAEAIGRSAVATRVALMHIRRSLRSCVERSVTAP